MSTRPPRTPPIAVPPGAEWCEEDKEWVLGPRDEDGEYHGEVSYWRPDGTLCCTCEHRHGKPHGGAKRFHENGELSATATYVDGAQHGPASWIACDEPTSELMHAAGMSQLVRRCEVQYVHGKPGGFRYFDREGNAVAVDGSALPARPEGVPEEAILNTRTKEWVAGQWNAEGKKIGLCRWWRADGTLRAEETSASDGSERAEGMARHYDALGVLRSELEYHAGELDGVVKQYRPDGTLARRARIEGTRWAGPLEDLDARGEQVVRETRFAEPPAAEAPAEPDDDEQRMIERLGDEELGPGAIDALARRGLSPAGLAWTIAGGWGGDDERDASWARGCRRLVRRAAPESVQRALGEAGLDRAPRLLTEERLVRLLAVLDPERALDSAALGERLCASDGPGLSYALGAGGSRALEALRQRLASGRLDLSRRGLTQLPAEISLLPRLERLELSNNQLRALPDELGDALLLQRLELGDNALTGLPDALSRLCALRALHLSRNGLEQLPEQVTQLTGLTMLNLSNNALTTLPPSFSALEQLEQLWLHDNPLQALPASFASLPRLRFLHLGDVPWAEVPGCVFELPALKELWIASRTLSRLPAEVARLPRLERLIIWYSSLEELPEELFGMTGLRELRVRENPLAEGTIERLREALPDCTIY